MYEVEQLAMRVPQLLKQTQVLPTCRRMQVCCETVLLSSATAAKTDTGTVSFYMHRFVLWEMLAMQVPQLQEQIQVSIVCITCMNVSCRTLSHECLSCFGHEGYLWKWERCQK